VKGTDRKVWERMKKRRDGEGVDEWKGEKKLLAKCQC